MVPWVPLSGVKGEHGLLVAPHEEEGGHVVPRRQVLQPPHEQTRRDLPFAGHRQSPGEEKKISQKLNSERKPLLYVVGKLVIINFSRYSAEYEGHSKSSKTNSKKYFIYEIYKIIFLHSFHPIWTEFFDGNIAYRSVMNWMETM